MKFALVNNKRVEATKGAKGICPNCGSEVFARCGPFRIDHWSHKGKRMCDPWKENKTEWHLSWQDKYPDEWQEISKAEENSVKRHRADVLTAHNLVIEFQHSHIPQSERISREKFWKNMVWVVDGTRLKRDYPRFLRGKDFLQQTKERGLFHIEFPEKCFPQAWLECSVPVIFDFLGKDTESSPNDFKNMLYCLFPNQNRVAFLSRKSFIDNTINGRWFSKQPETKEQTIKTPPPTTKSVKRKRVQTHYYDPRKGKFVKRKRL